MKSFFTKLIDWVAESQMKRAKCYLKRRYIV